MSAALGGIYEIVNTVNNKRYIGSATRFTRRWATHRSQLKRGVHHSAKLQRSWAKHGADAFEFRPLMWCPDRQAALVWEQNYLDEFKPEYNIASNATASTLGLKASAETRAKLSLARRARVTTAETRAKMSATMKGRVLTPEQCAKIGNAHRGKTIPLEMRARISAALTGKPGHPHTEEVKAKMSASSMGKKCPWMTAARTGVPLSPEWRQNVSRGKKGGVASAETKARMSEAQRARWAAQKAAQ